MQLRTAFIVLLSMVAIGSFGYFALGKGQWTLWECLYFTVVTISTVGFAETLPGMPEVWLARPFTVLLLVLGSGSLLYFASTFTAFVVEGDLRGVWRSQRMLKTIQQLEQHVVVCGAGSVGRHVIGELRATKTPFVAVDREFAVLDELAREASGPFLFVCGDATDDEVLLDAGVGRASALVTACRDDAVNLYVAITARSMAPTLRIIAKADDPLAVPKLKRAGADAVVAPNYIGGLRMVSEAIRPSVVQFLDEMLRDTGAAYRIEQVVPGEATQGKPIAELDVRRHAGALVIALRRPDGTHVYTPGPDERVERGSVLIVLARAQDLPEIRARLA